MEPIWKILRTKVVSDDWNGQHKGSLRSAIVGRQYPQARVKDCGSVERDLCLVCLSRMVDEERKQHFTEFFISWAEDDPKGTCLFICQVPGGVSLPVYMLM